MGPTLAALDPRKLADLQSNGMLDVIVVNGYAATGLAGEVTPDFYVMADPAFFDDRRDHEMQNSNFVPARAWDYLRAHGNVKICIPDNCDAPPDIDPARIIYFNCLGLEGFSKNIDPARPRGFISMTAYSALALAGAASYSRILIAGIENSWFQYLALTPDGRVALRSSHAYDIHAGQLKPLNFFTEDGVGAFFEDMGRLFGDLRLFSHLPVENLDTRTVIDAFPIARDAARYCID